MLRQEIQTLEWRLKGGLVYFKFILGYIESFKLYKVIEGDLNSASKRPKKKRKGTEKLRKMGMGGKKEGKSPFFSP